MKLFELENLKVSEIINYNGEEFVLERVQQFRSGHIEYQFSGTINTMNFFSVIVSPEKNVRYNNGNIFGEDDELDFDINYMMKGN